MHEVSLMEQTVDMAVACAIAQGAEKIHTIKLRIGDLSGVIPEAMQFAFSVVTAGTIAEGATLAIESVPARCYCPTCQQEFEPQDIIYACPNCDQLSTEIRQGKELELAAVEVS